MAVCCVDSETIFHEVTVENLIVRDGRFAGHSIGTRQITPWHPSFWEWGVRYRALTF
ncbi:MAG: hypothetical protein J5938_06765 [Clostridia bacterium]|nr:hypothetical protein [Clostridia bacterium]